ncbi:MAG: Swt1 family HEPN domain-containing protein [Bacillota bacterium]|nr:Swt1 family HEPN domain-containing protein [Bacillota bacterium]
MDATRALADAENALRDFIASVLARQRQDWVDTCGVSAERLAKWRERQETERGRQKGGVVEERLIYYADFYDLKTILTKNWSGPFSDALGDRRTMQVFLTELERLRDPDAHRRELLPHQQSLAVGISGEIRTRIVRYRSKMETTDDYFPRIESARDSLGNIWVPHYVSEGRQLDCNMVLRSGDVIEYTVAASDPEGLPLEYGMRAGQFSTGWQSSRAFQLTVDDSQIGKNFRVELSIRSAREYHAHGHIDDIVVFAYGAVLPRR